MTPARNDCLDHRPLAPPARRPARQQGIAIGVVIIALWLLAVLTTIAVLASRDSARSVNIDRMAKLILAQSAYIQQHIVSCVQDYPNGNNGDANAFDPAYPKNADGFSGMTCVGAPGTPRIWSRQTGDYIPTPPPGCNWAYYNDKTRVLPQLEFEIVCTGNQDGADHAAALTLVSRQASVETVFYNSNTLMFVLHR